MTVKSNFKLDDRIKSIDDIQTILCNNNDFVGCKGFFFDNFVQAKNLTKCHDGTLVNIDATNSDDHCFKAKDENGNERIGYYRFFIPEKLLKPVKKYRAYTLAEWVDQHEIGEVIHFRDKDYKQECCVMYSGYIIDEGGDIQDIRTTGRIMLINMGYLLQELFERYEICINGEWLPFGIIEE